MNLGTAIQTQRNALLRLLAGWLAVVVLLSVAPVSPAWTRWMRVFLFAVLSRAELAARCLVIVQARKIDGTFSASRARLSIDALLVSRPDTDEPPSLAELRARFLALRFLLKNLPSRAARLLQRSITLRVTNDASTVLSDARALAAMQHPAVDQCPSPSPWHPPKNACASVSISSTLAPNPERGHWRVDCIPAFGGSSRTALAIGRISRLA